MSLNFLTFYLNSSISVWSSLVFQIVGRSHCWSLYFIKIVWERSIAKNYDHVSVLFVVSKVLEKLVNNIIVNHLEKCSLFSDFQYGFRSQSTPDLLIVISDRIARALRSSGATWVVKLDISKTFYGVWHSGCLHKLKFHRISGQLFDLILSFVSNWWLQVVLDGKCWKEYPVNAGVP